MNINKVTIMGRLVADPELKTTPANLSVVRFTVAVNRRFTRKDEQSGARETDFIDCAAFGSNAEFLTRYFRKGSLIIVFGSLRVNNWQDKNGNRQRTVSVYVDELQFGEQKRQNADGPAMPYPPTKEMQEPDVYSNASESSFFESVKDIDTDLPF